MTEVKNYRIKIEDIRIKDEDLKAMIERNRPHPSMRVTLQNLENIFSYHNEEWKVPYYQEIRKAGKILAEAILKNCPPCMDRKVAIRKVREAVMTANASVALAHAPWETK